MLTLTAQHLRVKIKRSLITVIYGPCWFNVISRHLDIIPDVGYVIRCRSAARKKVKSVNDRVHIDFLPSNRSKKHDFLQASSGLLGTCTSFSHGVNSAFETEPLAPEIHKLTSHQKLDHPPRVSLKVGPKNSAPISFQHFCVQLLYFHRQKLAVVPE